MKLYLASAYCQQDELRLRIPELQELGYEIVSSWTHSGKDWTEEDTDGNFFAAKNLREVVSCEVFVLYLPDTRDVVGELVASVWRYPNYEVSHESALRVLRESGVTGGKDVEMGYALALGKRVIVVCPNGPVNVFHRLQEKVEWVSSFEKLIEVLV